MQHCGIASGKITINHLGQTTCGDEILICVGAAYNDDDDPRTLEWMPISQAISEGFTQGIGR